MNNQYSEIISNWTDENLIRLVEIESEKYPELQVATAKHEISKRGLAVSDFTEFIAEQLGLIEIEKRNQPQTIANSVRATNYFIDIFCWYLLTGILYYIFGGILGRSSPFLVLISFFLYYISMESLLQQTVGKIITKTYVVNIDNTKPNLRTIFIRTLCRLIPLEPLTFVMSSNGLHDLLSKTTVIKKN